MRLVCLILSTFFSINNVYFYINFYCFIVIIVFTGTIYYSSYIILMLYINLSRIGELRAVQYGEQAARDSFSALAEAHCALLSASFGAPTVSICTVYWVY